MLVPRIRPQLGLFDDGEVQRRAGRIPSRSQGAKPFGKVHVQWVGWERGAAAGEQRRQYRRRQRVGVIDRDTFRHRSCGVRPNQVRTLSAEASTLRWLKGTKFGAIVVPDVWRINAGASGSGSSSGHAGPMQGAVSFRPKFARLHRARIDNGNVVLFRHAQSRRADTAEHDHGVRGAW